MATKVSVTCDGCSATGTVELAMDVTSLSVGEGINVNGTCPACGHGKFSAPGGKYERNGDGELIRVGDYEPSPAN